MQMFHIIIHGSLQKPTFLMTLLLTRTAMNTYNLALMQLWRPSQKTRITPNLVEENLRTKQMMALLFFKLKQNHIITVVQHLQIIRN